MKKTLIILVLLFSSSVVAEDIADFEIEGMSIGDSLLDYTNRVFIETEKVEYYKDKTFSSINIISSDSIIDLKVYKQLVVSFITNDKKYFIQAISGIIKYDKDLQACKHMKSEIVSDLLNMFGNLDHELDIYKSGFYGEHTYTKFYFKNNDNIKISCVKYHPEHDFEDHLRISVNTTEFQEWLNYKAYK